MEREPQTGRTVMASGRPESAEEAAQATTVVAQRWFVHPSSSDVSQPRLEL